MNYRLTDEDVDALLDALGDTDPPIWGPCAKCGSSERYSTGNCKKCDYAGKVKRRKSGREAS